MSKRPPQAKTSEVATLSHAALCYATCLTTGVGEACHGCPVADAHGITIRYPFRYTGTFTTGSAGVGYCVVSPRSCAFYGINTAIRKTDGNYAGTIISTSTATAGVLGDTVNALYGYTASMYSVQPTCCVVSVQYDGTELNRAGHYVAATLPLNVRLNSATESQLLASPYGVRERVGERSFRVAWRPQSTTDFHPAVADTSAAWFNDSVIGVMVVGAGASQPFTVTVRGQMEMTMQQNVDAAAALQLYLATPPLHDIPGGNAVLHAINRMPAGTSDSQTSVLDKVVSGAERVLVDSYSGVRTLAGAAVSGLKPVAANVARYVGARSAARLVARAESAALAEAVSAAPYLLGAAAARRAMSTTAVAGHQALDTCNCGACTRDSPSHAATPGGRT